jgi:SAM-dependent methyltransferase
MNIHEKYNRERPAGGFTRMDGTIQFYSRVQALLPDNGVILDLGAGRGVIAEANSSYVRRLGDLRQPGRRVIGLDVDPIVRTNPILDEALVYDGTLMPLETASVDFIISEYTFEHIPDPEAFSQEIKRVLKPGGWLCARTPHLFSILAIASSVIPNRLHARVLQRVQPGRRAKDVFPTRYRLNTRRAVAKYFQGWKHFTYTFSPEPGYHFNSTIIYRLLQLYQYVKCPILGGEVLLVFERKPE